MKPVRIQLKLHIIERIFCSGFLVLGFAVLLPLQIADLFSCLAFLMNGIFYLYGLVLLL